eukprot:gene7098-10928_t
MHDTFFMMQTSPRKELDLAASLEGMMRESNAAATVETEKRDVLLALRANSGGRVRRSLLPEDERENRDASFSNVIGAGVISHRDLCLDESAASDLFGFGRLLLDNLWDEENKEAEEEGATNEATSSGEGSSLSPAGPVLLPEPAMDDAKKPLFDVSVPMWEFKRTGSRNEGGYFSWDELQEWIETGVIAPDAVVRSQSLNIERPANEISGCEGQWCDSAASLIPEDFFADDAPVPEPTKPANGHGRSTGVNPNAEPWQPVSSHYNHDDIIDRRFGNPVQGEPLLDMELSRSPFMQPAMLSSYQRSMHAFEEARARQLADPRKPAREGKGRKGTAFELAQDSHNAYRDGRMTGPPTGSPIQPGRHTRNRGQANRGAAAEHVNGAAGKGLPRKVGFPEDGSKGMLFDPRGTPHWGGPVPCGGQKGFPPAPAHSTPPPVGMHPPTASHRPWELDAPNSSIASSPWVLSEVSNLLKACGRFNRYSSSMLATHLSTLTTTDEIRGFLLMEFGSYPFVAVFCEQYIEMRWPAIKPSGRAGIPDSHFDTPIHPPRQNMRKPRRNRTKDSGISPVMQGY